ncbi:MAG: C40 family peptidase [Clostridia bacterium]|nr:C40 family peptidase [Clostridia bacterium]
MNPKTLRVLRVALACVLTAALLATGALAASYSARVNANTKVYKAPQKSSESTKAPKNMKVTLTASSGGWGKIRYKDKTAYIPIKYLTLADPIKSYVAVKSTVYKKPGSDKLGTLGVGQVVYVIGVNGKYARLGNKSGAVLGYVKAANLSRNKSATTTSKSDSDTSSSLSSVPEKLRSTTTSPSVSKIEYTIYVAQNLIGTPYAENSNPPDTFDCAKFTLWCYDKAESGVLKDSSKSQGYDDRYDKVSYGDLKRGDLVCFNTISTDDDESDHVGIYIGDGYFIHASSAGGKIMVSQMVSGSSDYYKRNFSWGRRIFKS